LTAHSSSPPINGAMFKAKDGPYQLVRDRKKPAEA
jgi:hypothetical protein